MTARDEVPGQLFLDIPQPRVPSRSGPPAVAVAWRRFIQPRRARTVPCSVCLDILREDTSAPLARAATWLRTLGTMFTYYCTDHAASQRMVDERYG